MAIVAIGQYGSSNGTEARFSNRSNAGTCATELLSEFVGFKEHLTMVLAG
jgi:hypothetical protein